VLTLVGRTLGRITMLTTALAGLLVAFQVAIVAIAASLEGDEGFTRLAGLAPAFLQQVLGPALTSFAGLTSLGFYEPLIVLLVVEFAIYLATEPAGDVESGLVDLVLARPLPRHYVVTRSLLVMTAAAGALPGVMALGLWASLAWLAPAGAAWPEPRVVGLLVAHLMAVAWCFGGAGLAAAAWARRRGAAQAAIGVTAVAMYLLDFVGDAWPDAGWLAWLSPFHAFHGAQILSESTHAARDLSVLFGLGALGVALAYWKFQRRDV